MSVNSTVVFVGGLVGKDLAPSEKLSTLPVAMLVVGTACASIPVTLLMRKVGRKLSFISILIFSIAIAITTAVFVYKGSFIGFCTSIFFFGVTSACAMQFRFAAMESVTTDLIPKAASSVLIGGIAAAFLGPEIALIGKDTFSIPYTGSFILLAFLFLLCLIILIFFQNPAVDHSSKDAPQRALKEIAQQPVFWVAILSATVGYAVMSFIMTATPVSMHVIDGHSLENTKWVIQSHILAMFVPSLIAALIISKLGTTRMMITGLGAYILCIGIAYMGHHIGNYWVSLVLLGIGWNFLFIGGTTLLPQSYQPSERFKVQAVNEFVVFGSQAIASLSAGWIVFTLGWERMLLFTLPIIFMQLIIIVKWAPKRNAAIG